jgi:hypothetical protein
MSRREIGARVSVLFKIDELRLEPEHVHDLGCEHLTKNAEKNK